MTPDAEAVTRHVLICGRVQGVGFRYWTEKEALARGLQGFVRNRRDGAVEAAFSGPVKVVDEMLQACRHGPRRAAVTSVEQVDDEPAAQGLQRPGERFSVLPTV